jgi:hypothetical protein
MTLVPICLNPDEGTPETISPSTTAHDERERETERDRDRERETERQRVRERETMRETMREDGLTNTEAIRDKDIIIASEVMIPNPRGTKRIHSHPNLGHTNDRLSSRDQFPIPTSEQ